MLWLKKWVNCNKITITLVKKINTTLVETKQFVQEIDAQVQAIHSISSEIDKIIKIANDLKCITKL